MIPARALSSVVIEAPFRYQVPKRTNQRESFTTDTFGQAYRFWLDDAGALWSQADGGEPVHELDLPGAVRMSACFDQNHRLHVVYNTAASCFFRWFDSQAGAMVTTEQPGLVDAHCILDDPRAGWNASSDVVLTYTRAGTLYAREQRDRFTVEFLMQAGVEGYRLIAVAMNEANRLQWELYPAD